MPFTGSEVLDEISQRIAKQMSVKEIRDSVLAREIGVTQPALANYRKDKVTARQVVNLMEKYAKRMQEQVISTAISPIVEFFPLDPVESGRGKSWQIFPIKDDRDRVHPFLSGLRERLEAAHGIYVFHDSRGRAIYAGKARKQSLWKEMNLAYNRDRGEIQSIKRVSHPTSRLAYKEPDEKNRQISRTIVALHDIANYASAYQVPDPFIDIFEALIVRAFANDLLNIKMEKLP